jgi:hypothetical protein
LANEFVDIPRHTLEFVTFECVDLDSDTECCGANRLNEIIGTRELDACVILATVHKHDEFADFAGHGDGRLALFSDDGCAVGNL